MSERLQDTDLQEIEQYLQSGSDSTEGRVRDWLQRLVGEVRVLREQADGPRKQHGDALLEGTGTRHGEHEVR